MACLEWNGVNSKLQQPKFHQRRNSFTGARRASLRTRSRNGVKVSYLHSQVPLMRTKPSCLTTTMSGQPNSKSQRKNSKRLRKDWKNHYPIFLRWRHHMLLCRDNWIWCQCACIVACDAFSLEIWDNDSSNLFLSLIVFSLTLAIWSCTHCGCQIG